MKKAVIIVGLAFGDEGKGGFTSSQTIQAHTQNSQVTIIRYNGGPQAAHNVVIGDKHHTFSQFGSGTLSGADTYLSQYMLIDPFAMDSEEQHLSTIGTKDSYNRLKISKDCVIITPFQRFANQQIAEINNHGSCGIGFGETVRDSLNGVRLTAGDLADSTFGDKLDAIRQAQIDKFPGLFDLIKVKYTSGTCGAGYGETFILDQKWTQYWIDRYNQWYRNHKDCIVDSNYIEELKSKQNHTMIFEGAQGVLLDEDYGYQPHVTWSKTTSINAYKLLSGYDSEITQIGIMRAYMTRHGNGPFMTEAKNPNPCLATRLLAGEHNTTGKFQGEFRIGYLDSVALRYAIGTNERESGHKLNCLAVSCLDRIDGLNLDICGGYLVDGILHKNMLFLTPKNECHSASHEVLQSRIVSQFHQKASPCYGPNKNYLKAIEEELDTKIWFTSYGPNIQRSLVNTRF